MSMFSQTDAGGDIANPQGVFINGPTGLLQLKFDCSAWASSDFVTTDGYIIPGAPMRYASGLLVPVDNTSQKIEFCAAESTYLGALKANLSSATDLMIGVASGGQINQDALEDLIGRVLSANELAAFAAQERFVLV